MQLATCETHIIKGMMHGHEACPRRAKLLRATHAHQAHGLAAGLRAPVYTPSRAAVTLWRARSHAAVSMGK